MVKFIGIGFGQYHQLVDCKKSCAVLFLPTWNIQKKWEVFSELSQLGDTASLDSIIFVVSVDVCGPCCDYIVDQLLCNSLPMIVQLAAGLVDFQSSVLSELRTYRYDYPRFLSSNVCSLYNKDIDYVAALFRSPAYNCEEEAVRVGSLFISGDRSSVGKSTVALALLDALVKRGVSTSMLSYIKPVTQCEMEQPVTRYCKRVGIAEESIGPVVFYQGFTRSFLAGETESADQLLEKAVNAVGKISSGKLFTLVDGVGYPAVGSICSISNADVAHALHAPVILVGKSGVGDAVDSYNLNSAFFEHKNVRVLGGIFNKISRTGFYALDQVKNALTSYFTQYRMTHQPYGFIPLTDATSTSIALPSLPLPPEAASKPKTSAVRNVSAAAAAPAEDEENILTDFGQYVDVNRIIHDLWMYHLLFQGTLLFDTKVDSRDHVGASVSYCHSYQYEHQIQHQPQWQSQHQIQQHQQQSRPQKLQPYHLQQQPLAEDHRHWTPAMHFPQQHQTPLEKQYPIHYHQQPQQSLLHQLTAPTAAAVNVAATRKRSREEIMQEAALQGAKEGG